MDKIDLIEFCDNESEPVEIPQQIDSDLDINEATESNVRERTGQHNQEHRGHRRGRAAQEQRNENRTSFTLQPLQGFIPGIF